MLCFCFFDRFLEREARDCEYVVLWLDCDKEGENICFEVLNIIRPVMKHSVSKNFIAVYIFIKAKS